MGLKLQGILINKNFKDEQPYIFSKLGITDYKLTNRSFYTDHWNGFMKRNKIVLSFYKNATIISCDSHFLASEKIKLALSQAARVAGFFQYDTISTFAFDIFQDGLPIRRLYSDRASKFYKYEEGESQPFEATSNGVESIFIKMTEDFLGTRIDSSYLHEEAESFEYRFKYHYPGLLNKLMGKTDHHAYWKKIL